jgi:hypothetical protein
MIAAAILAASVLAPSGVTATIQGDPVCLPVVAQPGHSYPLAVSASGSGPLTLAVVPAHGTLERHLHQVPPSWVTFSPAGPGKFTLTLTVRPDAEPGAYWSDVEAATGGQPQPGGGGQAVLGAAATTGIVFTVGPSSVPPPPCDALSLAQSTGQFPAWPTPAFKTTSWTQVYARDSGGPVTPDGGPTATARAQAPSAAAPAAGRPVTAVRLVAASSGHMPPALAKFLGWAVVIAIIALVAAGFLRLLGVGK